MIIEFWLLGPSNTMLLIKHNVCRYFIYLSMQILVEYFENIGLW